ncbi:hypothetical protein FHX44_11217 [Pseudonocardia hierapolitana]|uniref:Uncharacterized protein n=1 Tax=Pseudonocardia hierapolitana TaxID=1128676 RepID=A0A561SHL8_9PSEU|nr:hypothetical protein [Pseudonocardia hierapolitana]TWF74337.1 hypothetical protein FHX44_11217 [Pseudonocardia hierapolitana]
MDDPRLDELSGLVVHDGGLWAMSDGGRRVQVHRIDRSNCAVIDTRAADVDPYDVEDLAVGPDGALWVGDLGDNERRRETVAVVVLPERGDARLHRLAYPDGPHDAEALLVDSHGRPFVITKEVGRPAGLYRTADAPDGEGPTPLLRVGELALPASDTLGGPVGGIGTRLITGAALSADGTVAAVRTYTDAWLFPMSGGDLVAAFNQAPVRVPLPDEPQGEAIAFEPDGTLLSGSETRRGVRGEIRGVAGAAALAGEADPVAPLPPAPEVVPDPGAPPWLPAALGGGAVVGVLLLVTAAAALRGRLRRG